MTYFPVDGTGDDKIDIECETRGPQCPGPETRKRVGVCRSLPRSPTRTARDSGDV